MKKILFFTLPFLGHINPNIESLITLSKKYEVMCVSSPKYKSFFNNLGLEMLEYPDCINQYYGDGVINDEENIVKKYYASQYNSHDMSAMSKKSIELLEDIWFELGESIRKFGPDLILNDAYAFWGGPIANIINVNYINIESATDMMNNVQDLYFEKYIQEVISKETSIDINTHEVIKESNIVSKQQHKKFVKFAHKTNKNYKLPLITLAHMSKSLQVGADEMDIPYKYIGFDLDKEVSTTKQNVIYISRGTINDSYNERIIKNIIGVFEFENDYKIIASCGVRADSINIFNNNNNVHIYKSVNQIEYLQKSKLFISHGGITGVREAIICETPIIIFPTTFHCFQVGMAIEKFGAGIMLKEHSFDKTELKEAVNRILNCDVYNQNIKKLKKELINVKKENNMCSIIENYL